MIPEGLSHNKMITRSRADLLEDNNEVQVLSFASTNKYQARLQEDDSSAIPCPPALHRAASIIPTEMDRKRAAYVHKHISDAPRRISYANLPHKEHRHRKRSPSRGVLRHEQQQAYVQSPAPYRHPGSPAPSMESDEEEELRANLLEISEELIVEAKEVTLQQKRNEKLYLEIMQADPDLANAIVDASDNRNKTKRKAAKRTRASSAAPALQEGRKAGSSKRCKSMNGLHGQQHQGKMWAV
jgi:hypothetical protein